MFIKVFYLFFFFFFFQAEDGIRDHCVTGVQTCALPISSGAGTGRGVVENTHERRRERKGQEVASCRKSKAREKRVLESLCRRLLHRVHRAEENRQKLLLPGLDGIRKAGIVTDGPGVR